MVNDTTSTLPKPITMTGSAFEDKAKKVEVIEESKKVVEEVKDENKEMDELPMPVVFGDDDSTTSDDSNSPAVVTDDTASSNTVTDDDDTKIIKEDEGPLEIEVPEESEDKEVAEIKVPISSKVKEEGDEEKEDEVPELILNDDSDEVDVVPRKTEELKTPKLSLSSDEEESEELPEEKVEVKPIAENEPEEEESSFEIPKLDNFSSIQAKREDVASDVKVIQNQEPSFRPPTASAGINNQTYFSQPSAPIAPQYSPEMQRQMQPVNNMGQENSGGVPKIVLGILGVFIGGGLVVGGYFTANKIFGKGEAQIAQQAVSEPVASPVPQVTQIPTTPIPVTQTPKPSAKDVVLEEDLEETVDNTVKKEDLTIKILNGSGEKGVAKVVRTLLVEEGFTDVKTGNAENFDYKKSYISYKPEYEDFIDEITTILEDTYTLIKDEELKASDDYDFYIILGPEETTTKTEE